MLQESAHKMIPIMLVATKTDLRDELARSGRKGVESKVGRALAKVYKNPRAVYVTL